MPKKRIPPEIKAQIIQTIKNNPKITIEDLRERFKIDDGRVIGGFRRYALGLLAQHIKPLVQQNIETEKKPKEVEMPEPIEVLANKVTELASKIDTLGLKEKEKENQLKEAETKQERETIKSSIANLQADIAKTSSLLEGLTKSNKDLSVANLQVDMTKTSSLLEELAKSNKTLCELVPNLCTKGELDTILSEKLKPKEPEKPAEPPKPKEGKKGILETGHDTIEDLLACPECLLGHIKKVGFNKAAEEICKDDESCKATIAELTKKGYKVEEPKKEEGNEGKDEEEEGNGSFTLGQGEGEAPTA